MPVAMLSSVTERRGPLWQVLNCEIYLRRRFTTFKLVCIPGIAQCSATHAHDQGQRYTLFIESLALMVRNGAIDFSMIHRRSRRFLSTGAQQSINVSPNLSLIFTRINLELSMNNFMSRCSDKKALDLCPVHMSNLSAKPIFIKMSRHCAAKRLLTRSR